MSVAFSEFERDFLRANAQRLQFEKLAEAARIAYVGAAVNSAIAQFVSGMQWLHGRMGNCEYHFIANSLGGL